MGDVGNGKFVLESDEEDSFGNRLRPTSSIVHSQRPGISRNQTLSLTVIVNIVQLRARLVPATNHRADRKPVPAVRVERVGQQLRGCGHADALLVAQLVEPALHAEVALPEGAVRCAAGHRAEQVRVDLDDLLHALRGCRVGKWGEA